MEEFTNNVADKIRSQFPWHKKQLLSNTIKCVTSRVLKFKRVFYCVSYDWLLESLIIHEK